MKELIFEKRMYPGYPVFELVYFDADNNRYNYTTASSMYTLNKMVVLGLNDNNALKCITKSKQFSINFLTKEYFNEIQHGSTSGIEINKFTNTNLDLIDLDNNKAIKQSQLVYNCSFIENHICSEFNKYNNVIARIDSVYISNDLYVDNSLDILNFKPVFYYGTDKEKVLK